MLSSADTFPTMRMSLSMLSAFTFAFAEAGLNVEFYANRERSYEEVFPWDHIDYYVDKQFLIRENEKAKQAQTTQHCRLSCANCGVIKKTGKPCFSYSKQ